MHVLPQTPLDWVLLAVALATAIIIAVAMQDFFLDSRVNNPRIRALQDVALVFAVSHFGAIVLRGSASANAAIAGIAMYVAATLLFLSALEAARRVPLPRTFVDDPPPKALITTGPFALVRHPFYIAYSVAWLAAPVATHGPIVTAIALIQIATYVIAARREERQLEARFGEAYRAYKLGTGVLVPSLARLFQGRSSR
ncbi:MAG TPA: isoprenylcysteine carboxylmethyltransferase family protein [Vicinamibacterales bacterium]|nr:isoprenylcysteine carboxylmethyltransferase family protein [Vicinamibacterales bacterium]